MKLKDYKLDTDKMKDKLSRFRTNSLFNEQCYGNRRIEANGEEFQPPFTLKEYSLDGYLSFGRAYIEIGDPTGYKQAMALLGSWQHWKVLCNCAWFKDKLDEWNEELDMKIKAEAWAMAQDVAKNSSTESVRMSAIKFIHDNGADGNKVKRKRGRPSNEEKKAFLQTLTAEASSVEEDFQRISKND